VREVLRDLMDEDNGNGIPMDLYNDIADVEEWEEVI
jgi:hypothetical protein